MKLWNKVFLRLFCKKTPVNNHSSPIPINRIRYSKMDDAVGHARNSQISNRRESLLPTYRVTRRKIAGMQSRRGYLYVSLSVAALSKKLGWRGEGRRTEVPLYSRECRTRKMGTSLARFSDSRRSGSGRTNERAEKATVGESETR